MYRIYSDITELPVKPDKFVIEDSVWWQMVRQLDLK